MNRSQASFARFTLIGWLAYDFAVLAMFAATGDGVLTDFVLLAAIAAALMGVARRPQPLAARVDGQSLLACALALGLMFGGIAVADTPYQPSAASDALELAAALLLLWSTIALGRCFAVLPAAIGCVTTGPYALVRHPIYTAYILWTLALALAYPHPLVGLAGVAAIGALGWRAILEEGLLRKTFPDYCRYSARVRARFIPGVA
jgi:protein-S-isoprenylcysteine O-methyltransferase Ste14